MVGGKKTDLLCIHFPSSSSILSLSSIALFPNNKTHTYTTVDMLLALVLWAYLELFFFPLSRDAITTVVDQSLKSLRIVSYIYIYIYIFFVILFLPVRCCCCSSSSWSSHLFFLYDSVVVVKGLCCWCVILYSMYHCLSFFSFFVLYSCSFLLRRIR